jgi:hypothetical protein
MLSKAEQANLNLSSARELRSQGCSYRDIRRQLAITPSQISHIKRALKREKAARTRLMNRAPNATYREIPVRQTALPAGLRDRLATAGLSTLGEIADRLDDLGFAGLQGITGIGPHKARHVIALLDHYELRAGSDQLQAAVEQLFPEFGDETGDGVADGETAHLSFVARPARP